MARLNFYSGYKQIRITLHYVNETPCITVSICNLCNYKSELASYLILLLFKIKYSFVSIVIEKSQGPSKSLHIQTIATCRKYAIENDLCWEFLSVCIVPLGLYWILLPSN